MTSLFRGNIAHYGRGQFGEMPQFFDMHAGDTILVSLDVDRTRALPIWRAVTAVVYNLAVSIAAIRQF